MKLLIPAITLLLLVACRVAPVYEVQQAQLVAPRAVTTADVERAIRAAGASLGWQMLQRGSGNLEGVLIVRDHRAIVDIKYDSRTFSIKYRDSSNLGYDGSTIHANYNEWVRDLERAIRVQVSAL